MQYPAGTQTAAPSARPARSACALEIGGCGQLDIRATFTRRVWSPSTFWQGEGGLTMCAQTTDPACACATPWADLTLDQQKEFIKSVGGQVAAADYILSGRAGGGSQNRERNRRIRETHLQGRGIDHDHDDLSTSAAPKARVSRGGPARAFDEDAWGAILLCYPDDAPDRDILIWLYPDLLTTKTLRFPSFIVFSSALTAYANRKECAQGYRGLRS